MLVRLLEAAARYANAARNLGAASAAVVLWRRLFPTGGTVRLRTRQFGEIRYRPDGDYGALTHLFVPLARIDTQGDPVRCVFDLGANIGTETARFRVMYPEAKIVAVEPEPANYRLLAANTAGMSGVVTVNKAVWNGVGQVPLFKGSTTNESYSTLPSDGPVQVVETTTIPALMSLAGAAEIDILKMDIEGAEFTVFDATCDEWLPHVKCIVMECVDKDAPGTAARIFDAFRRNGLAFNVHVHGENLVFVRGDLGWLPRTIVDYSREASPAHRPTASASTPPKVSRPA